MAGQKRTITGPLREDGVPNTTTSGTGYRIGDGYTLTAGHVVYEWNRNRNNPDIIDGSNTVVSDYRGYRGAYLAAANQQIALEKSGINIANHNLGIEGTLTRLDSVIISGGGSVGAGADGLVVFLNPSVMTSPSSVLSGASVVRDGNTTGLVSGNVISASGGRLTYDTDSLLGDSGGAYLLSFNGRDYVIGTQSAQNNTTGNALGTYFTPGEWYSINQLIISESGDLTDSDPTNMVVGSGGADNTDGSSRADIILGLGGADELKDGDVIGAVRYGRDELYGGAGDDKLFAGDGKDLLHGGDHKKTATVLALDDDGQDQAGYKDHATGIKIKLATKAVDSTFSAQINLANALWVEELGGTKVHDTLVSIEKIIATDVQDTIQVDALDASFLAGDDNKGGLAEIDLGKNPDAREKGDHVDFSKMEAAVKADLDKGRVELADDAKVGFKITNGENLTGGKKNDELIGNVSKNIIKGGEGDDKIKGGAEADLLEGEKGKDEIDGEAGEDEIAGGDDDDKLSGGAENDKLDGGAGDDTLIGGSGLDTFSGGAGKDTLDGGKDDDGQAEILDGGSGDDTYYGGDGDTIVDLDPGDAVFSTSGGAAGARSVAAASAGGETRRLTGGEREKPPEDPCAEPSWEEEEDESGTYESSDGTIYEYDKDSGTLSVDAGGVSLTITGFKNGEAGIRLKDKRPEQAQAECQRDPLIIDLNGDREVVEELYDSQAYFDLDDDGFAEHVAWALPEDGLLALDRNGDGLITSGSELFGTGRTTAGGGRLEQDGTDGFTELAKLDSNADGKIDAQDEQFAALRVWQDANGDAVTDAGELKSLAEVGIAAISLAKTASNDLDCGCDGTDVVSMARVELADGGTTIIYDAFLSIDQYDSRELYPAAVSEAAAALPQLLGSGQLSDLQVAMSRDPALLEMVEALASLPVSQAGELFARVEQILLRWTGADQVAIDGRGPHVNGRWVHAIETITGSSFEQALIGASPRQDAASMLTTEWQQWVVGTAAKLIGQTAIGEALTPGLSFAAGAFFTVATGTTLADALLTLDGQAPDGLAEATAYWHVMLGTLGRYAGELGVKRADIAAAADQLFASRGLPFSAAQIGDAVIASGASELMTGTFRGFGSGGDDLLVVMPGVSRVVGGTGADVYVLEKGARDVEVDDVGGEDVLYVDALPEEVRFEFEIGTHGVISVSVVSDAGVLASFALEIGQSHIASAIETIRFAEGSIRHVTEGTRLLSPDGEQIVFGDYDDASSLVGGSGIADKLVGYKGSDNYFVDPNGGDDQVREQGGAVSVGDRLVIDAPRDDIVFELDRGSGGDSVRVRFLSTGAEVILVNQRYGENYIELFEFSDGSSLSVAALDALLATGSADDDVITGSSRGERIDGRGGDDLLRGQDGRDDYLFGPESGHDRIQDTDLLNRVVVAAGVSLSDLRFERGGPKLVDLVVRIDGADASLLIENGLRQAHVVEFLFADGSAKSFTEIMDVFRSRSDGRIDGSDRDDELFGTALDERLDGGPGDDRIDGGEGSDTYVFSSGRDSIYDSGLSLDFLVAPPGATLADIRFRTITGSLEISFRGHTGSVALPNQGSLGRSGEDDSYGEVETVRFSDGSTAQIAEEQLHGTAGDDFLFDLSYEDWFYFPGSGDDLILSGVGDTGVAVEPGFGNIVIADRGGDHDGLYFTHPDILLSDISFARSGFDLVIRIAGQSGSVTIENQFHPNNYWSDEAFEVISLIERGTFTANDILEILSVRTAGDDWIAVGERDGGSGNDLLVGDERAQEYVFAAGYGHDVIRDYGWDSPEGSRGRGATDTLRLDGLNQADVLFSRAPDDPHSILLTIKATGETLLIDRTLWDGEKADHGWRHYSIEEFLFADGSTLTGRQVRQQVLGASSTDGADAIVGLGVDTLADGGGGDDRIEISGGGGVVLAPGGGDDIVWFSGDSYALVVSVRGASPADVLVREVSEAGGVRGAHLRLELPDGSSLTLLHAAWPDSEGFIPDDSGLEGAVRGTVDRFDFEDGTSIDYNGQRGSLASGKTIGTSGNDGLTGGVDPESGRNLDDLFDPGAGDDLIFGAGGQDRILFGRGSGQDEVLPGWKGPEGTFTVSMLPGVAAEDVTIRLSEDGQQLVIGFVDAPDTVRIGVNMMDAIAFEDGRQLLFRDPDDQLYGYAGDELAGGLGDDTIGSWGGGLTIGFGPGDGVDTVFDDFFDSMIGEDASGWDWTGNRIAFEGVTSAAELLFARDEQSPDLAVIIRATGERVIVKNQFLGSGVSDDPTRLEAVVTAFVLEGGQVLSWSEAQALVENLDAATVPVSRDPLVTRFDLTQLYATPSEGEDVLFARWGEQVDSLAGDDRIIALDGSVAFLWSAGDGDDRFVAAGRGGNLVRFENVATPLELQFLRGGDDLRDLVIVNRATNERLTIAGQFAAASGGGAEPPVLTFEFADGTAFAWRELFGLVEGLDLRGDNVLRGDDAGSVLDGGAGNDALRGGAGDDVYLFDRNYGEDSIRDAGGNDVVQFGDGVQVGDVFFSRTAAGALLIEVTGRERLALLVEGQFVADAQRIESFLFAGGDRLDWRDVEQAILDTAATTRADIIVGFRSDNRIAGRDGNDVLRGAGGDDLIDGGTGRDVAQFSGARDQYEVTELANGRTQVRDLVAGRDGTDLLVSVEELRFLGDTEAAGPVLLRPENRAPAITAVTVAGQEDREAAVPLATLLAGIVDPDGDPVKITGVIGATGGQAWIGLDGQLRFRPSADFSGEAIVRYQAADPNGGFTIGTVSIAVASVEDLPTAAFDGPEEVTVIENAEPGVIGRVVGADADGDALSYVIAGGNGNGLFAIRADGTVTTARAAQDADVGLHELIVEVADPGGQTARLTIAVQVNGVNDAPTAASAAYELSEDGPVQTGQIAALDPDAAAPLAFELDEEVDGLLLREDGGWTFDPSNLVFQNLREGERRIVEAGVSIYDEEGARGVAVLRFTVVGRNDAPALSLEPPLLEPITEDAAPGAFGRVDAADAEGDVLAFAIAEGDRQGLFAIDADGQLSSTRPAEDADVGEHLVKVAVSDGNGGSVTTDVRVRVVGVNDTPIARPAAAAATEDGAILTGALTLTDPDLGDSHVFALVAPVAGLTLSTDGRWNFDLAGAPYQILKAGEQQVVIADYRVTDHAGAQSVSALSITLTGVNDLPTLAISTTSPLAIAEGAAAAAVAQLVANDIDGDALSFAIVGGDPAGLFAIDGTGALTTRRVADDPDVGAYRVAVKVDDGQGGSSLLEVPIRVTNVNDAPRVATPLADQNWKEGSPLSFQVPANSFTDADGDALVLAATSSDGMALPGWLRFDAASGRFTGTPPAGSAGTLAIKVQASDGSAAASDVFSAAIAPAAAAGSTGGFSYVSLNSWYDPRWGGGYNVTYRYTVQADAIRGGQLKLWDIVASYDGLGQVSSGWVNNFNGPTQQTLIANGDGLIYSTVGTGYQPNLKVGDTFLLTLRVDGAAWKADDFDFTIFDRDSPAGPSGSSASMFRTGGQSEFAAYDSGSAAMVSAKSMGSYGQQPSGIDAAFSSTLGEYQTSADAWPQPGEVLHAVHAHELRPDLTSMLVL